MFLVATGRMHRAIVNRLGEAGLGELDTPVISYQGALVKTAISDKVLFDNSLDLDVITDVISEARALFMPRILDDTYAEKEMRD